MLKMRDLYWLAGLIEGEGCFGDYDSPTIAVTSTDEDIIKRISKLFNCNYHHKKTPTKLQYVIKIHSTLAISWMLTLYPLMGERRQSKIKECILKWKSQKRMNTDPLYFNCGHKKIPSNVHYNRRTTRCSICNLKYAKENYQRKKNEREREIVPRSH